MVLRRFGRFVVVLLIVEFLLAFAFGLWLQRKAAGREVFLGATLPARAEARSASFVPTRPGNVLDLGTSVLEPREHEQQVRQPVHIA